MSISISKHLRGYVRIRISGYSPERFLNLCKHKEIEIWGLEARAEGYEMYLKASDVRTLKPILRKTRTHFHILERLGTPFFIQKNKKRKGFFLGFIFCVTLVIFLSRFIWKIDINGNQAITDQVLLEYLMKEDVFHGMKRKDVRCDEIVTRIREKFEDIIWVSASMEGCDLMISVRENTDTFHVSKSKTETGNIIANSDGIITKIITRNGVPCVKVGDEVKKGDILVSGTIEVMNDAGEVIRESYVRADADVFADTILTYEDTCRYLYQQKVYKKRKRTQYYIRFKDTEIGFGLFRSKSKDHEMRSIERQLVLNETFSLPLWIGSKSSLDYEWATEKHTKEEAKQHLEKNLSAYCKELEEQGAVIQKQYLQSAGNGARMRLYGRLYVLRPIGTWVKSVDF